MSLKPLLKKNFEFILFGGKGGVGKTSCASACALKLADAGRKTLLFSTDPAHSLSNSWDQKFGNVPQAVKGVKNLAALEIDAAAVMEEFKKEYGEELTELFETSTYLDKEDIGSILTLPVPGMDEIMGLKKIMDFMEEKEYEVYVADTAPTGHTLRLLAMPQVIDHWIKVAAKMRWKYRYMVSRFSGKEFEVSVDRFLLDLKKAVRRVHEHLTNAQRSEFVVVTLAEAMVVRQTEDLVAALRREGIPSRHMIVNHLTPEGDCAFCRNRRKGQSRYVNELKQKFPEHEFTLVNEQMQEIRGKERLELLASLLF
jgi:arsenite-transporting ATPase